MAKRYSFVATAIVLTASVTLAQDWNTVVYVKHSTYQAVNADGTSAYAGGFPIRMVGVVLNNTEDWLDPTPAYTASYVPFAMGGQAEFYVQSLWESTLPLLGVEYYDPTDFGGSACWMGQNYGNLPFKSDPSFSYTDAEWTAELGRLNLYGGDEVTDPIRAGDLVEIRARAGLHYKGKMNVNEQHSKDPANDFEIVRLLADYGLPTPAPLLLSDLKNPDDTFIFDSTRQTGGERYQSTLVELLDTWVASSVEWSANSDITVTDGVRTFDVHLGLNPSFDGTELFAPGEHFNVTGILDQSSTSGVYGTDGYRLLVMNAANITPVAIPGDTDGDGDVDLDDLFAVRNNFGITSGATLSDGDTDGDGDVDLDDLFIVRNNFGTGSGAAAPEPTTIALLSLGSLALFRRRR